MTLKWKLLTKHIRPHVQLQAKFQQKVSKLEAHLTHFREDAVHLQVNLSRHPKKEWFTATLTLHLPMTILRAEKEGEDPVPVFDQAIRVLLREVALFKSTLRHEEQWQRTQKPLIAAEG